MRMRRRFLAADPAHPTLQIEEPGGTWRTPDTSVARDWAWLPEPASEPFTAAPRVGSPALPFQPRSFRDCSLYEQHWIDASRGYARRFMPAASKLTSLVEALTRRPFPAFKPHPLAYRQPVYYFGNHLSFVPSGTSIRYPAFTRALDYELELGLVLRAPLRDATPDEALHAIGGFVVVNDWSSRDIQRAEMATGLGPQKSKHFCSSMSAELVDAASVLPRIEQLSARVEINGQTVARTSTANMLHRWGQTLAWLSRDETLHPGELIASGTLPQGSALENDHWLRVGDHLRLVIDEVGEIEHQVLA